MTPTAMTPENALIRMEIHTSSDICINSKMHWATMWLIIEGGQHDAYGDDALKGAHQDGNAHLIRHLQSRRRSMRDVHPSIEIEFGGE